MHPSFEMPFPEPVADTPVFTDNFFAFSIRFGFNETIYHARVVQKETTVMEYHVSDVRPALPFLPEPFVVASNLRRDLFDFPVNETYYPVALGKAIVAAIETVCFAKDLPVFSIPAKHPAGR
jgi:hypothetical protein